MDKVDLMDIMNDWYQKNQRKSIVGKHIENIFRNALNLGCFFFFMNTVISFTDLLKKKHMYSALIHLFNSFIRKDFLSIKLVSSKAMGFYFNVIMIYTIGFINTDRLDG
jgi:hypothetical protein